MEGPGDGGNSGGKSAEPSVHGCARCSTQSVPWCTRRLQFLQVQASKVQIRPYSMDRDRPHLELDLRVRHPQHVSTYRAIDYPRVPEVGVRCTVRWPDSLVRRDQPGFSRLGWRCSWVSPRRSHVPGPFFCRCTADRLFSKLKLVSEMVYTRNQISLKTIEYNRKGRTDKRAPETGKNKPAQNGPREEDRKPKNYRAEASRRGSTLTKSGPAESDG